LRLAEKEKENRQLTVQLMELETEKAKSSCQAVDLEAKNKDISARLDLSEANCVKLQREMSELRSQLEVSNCSRDVTNTVLLGLTSQALGMKAQEAENARIFTHQGFLYNSLLHSQSESIQQLLQERNYSASSASQEAVLRAVSGLLEKVLLIGRLNADEGGMGHDLEDSAMQDSEVCLSEALGVCQAQIEAHIKQDINSHIQDMQFAIAAQERLIVDLQEEHERKYASQQMDRNSDMGSEAEGLREQLRDSAALVQELEVQQEQMQQSYAFFQQQVEALKGVLDQKDRAILELRSQLHGETEALQQRLVSEQARNAEHQREIASRDELTAELEQMMQQMEGELLKHEARVTAAEASCDLKSQLLRTAEVLKRQNEQRAQLVERLSANTKDMKAFMQQAEQERLQVVEETARASAEWDRCREGLESRVEELQHQKIAVEGRLEGAIASLSKLCDQRDALEERNLSLERQCGELDKRCSQLSTSLEALRVEKQDIEATLTASESTSRRLEDRITELKYKADGLNCELKKAGEAMAAMNGEVAALYRQKDETEGRLTEALARCKELETEHDSVKQRKAAMDAEIEELRQQLAEQHSQLQVLEEEKRGMEVLAEEKAQEFDSLKAEQIGLQRSVACLQEEVTHLGQRCSQHESDVDALQRRKTALEHGMASLRENSDCEVQSLRQELQTAAAQYDVTQQYILILQESSASMESQVQQLTAACSRHEAEVLAAREEKKRLEDALQAARSDMEQQRLHSQEQILAAERRLSEASADCTSLRQQLADQDVLRASLEARVRKLEASLADAETEKDHGAQQGTELTSRLHSAQEASQALLHKLSAANAENDELRQSVAKLETQTAMLSRQIEVLEANGYRQSDDCRGLLHENLML